MQACVDVTEYTLTGGPSQRFNNLSTSSNGLVAYVDRNRVGLDDLSTRTGKFLVVDQAKVVTQVKFISINCMEYLAIVSDVGLSLYDPNGESLLAFMGVDVLTRKGDQQVGRSKFLCGVDGVQGTQYCAVGTSSGNVGILFFDERKNKLDVEHSLPGHNRAVCTLSSSISYLVSGDEIGQVIVWNATSFDQVCQFPSMGPPCSCVLVRADRVIASFASGVIRIYDVLRNKLDIEIDAHCRALNGMDIHPVHDAFATVGEDSFLNVWQLPDKRNTKIRVISSEYLPHNILVGVQFAKDSSNKVLTTSYDKKCVTIRS